MPVQKPLVIIDGQQQALPVGDTIPLAAVPVMTATVGGAVPTPPNNITTFLRGDGTFAALTNEGTFTPTIVGTTTAGAGTYSIQTGTYTKIGRAVIFQIYLEWSAHTGTGNMNVAGLPFTSSSVANTHTAIAVVYVNSELLIGSNILTAYVQPGSTTVVLLQTPSGAALTSGSSIMLSGTYFV